MQREEEVTGSKTFQKFVFLCEEREECANLQRELEKRPTGDGEGKR